MLHRRMSEISFEYPPDYLVEGIQSYKNRVYASVDEYACHQPASAIYREPLSRIFLSCPDPMFDRVLSFFSSKSSHSLCILSHRSNK